MKTPVSRILLNLFVVAVAVFFLTPLLWFIFAPFNPQASLSVAIPETFSLANFQEVLNNNIAMRGLLNTVIIGLGTMIGVSIVAAMAAYGLSRSNIPGRNIFTYVLILFSSVVTGTASMVPIFKLIYDMGLIDT
ncbi:MAG: carbohydrate ABC transporter permease, partial [Anaerolineae bacterium]|nr:carbohydrate ABC transporter permease [Anaerolineae bacterium]